MLTDLSITTRKAFSEKTDQLITTRCHLCPDTEALHGDPIKAA